MTLLPRLALLIVVPGAALADDTCPVNAPVITCGGSTAGQVDAIGFHTADDVDAAWDGVYGACGTAEAYAMPQQVRTFVCPPGGTTATFVLASDACDLDLFVLADCGGDTCAGASITTGGAPEQVEVACAGNEVLYVVAERADAGDADPAAACSSWSARDYRLSAACTELCDDDWDNDLDGAIDEDDADCAPGAGDTDVVTLGAPEATEETDAGGDSDLGDTEAACVDSDCVLETRAADSGCSCDTPAAPSAGSIVGLALLALRRRRR